MKRSEFLELLDLLISLEDQTAACTKQIKRLRKREEMWMQKPVRKPGDASRFVKRSSSCARQAEHLEKKRFDLGLRAKRIERHLVKSLAV